MSKLKLSITMSLDGYVAGPDQSEANPLGSACLDLHEWFFPLRAFRELHGEEGGDVNASSPVAEERLANIGATVMGRNMFGPVRGPWTDESWRGWWGENPPFHHPVFVLTHHPREPLQMQGGTTRQRRDRVSAEAGAGCRTGTRRLVARRRVGGQPISRRRAG
jgi:dihydrofolate reductase